MMARTLLFRVHDQDDHTQDHHHDHQFHHIHDDDNDNDDYKEERNPSVLRFATSDLPLTTTETRMTLRESHQ